MGYKQLLIGFFMSLALGFTAQGQSMSPFNGIGDTLPSQPNIQEARNAALGKIALIKRALNLTHDQEPAWRSLEKSLVEYEFARIDHALEMRDFLEYRRKRSLGIDPVERMQISSKQLRETSDNLVEIAKNLQPLLDVLNDNQKRKLFTMLPRANEVMERPTVAPAQPRLLHQKL